MTETKTVEAEQGFALPKGWGSCKRSRYSRAGADGIQRIRAGRATPRRRPCRLRRRHLHGPLPIVPCMSPPPPSPPVPPTTAPAPPPPYACYGTYGVYKIARFLADIDSEPSAAGFPSTAQQKLHFQLLGYVAVCWQAAARERRIRGTSRLCVLPPGGALLPRAPSS